MKIERVIFDCETTGLLQPSAAGLDGQPHIISIYMVKLDGDFGIIDEFESYIKPPFSIPEFITKINGIDDDRVSTAPIFPEIAGEIAEFFNGATEMIAHNLAFDKAMVGNEVIRSGYTEFPWPEKETCTVQHSMSIEQRRISLTRLHEVLLGKPFKDVHTAKGDVHALVRCYHKMLELGMCN